KEGQTIQCSLWRGEGTLVDPKANWKYVPEIGFVKGDQIHNDPGLCKVIGQEAPEPSVVPYLFVFIFELMLCFGIRFALYATSKEDEDDSDQT
ncbi:MAG: hypothetical protein WCW84_10425, partial [Sulfurimonas sp.]